MSEISLTPFTEEQYHAFFRRYVPDPLMTSQPFRYSYEQISASYRYNYGGFQKGYAHYGIFLDGQPVGSFQLKRMDPEKGSCEFGIILQSDGYKNRGIGTEAIRIGLAIARERFGMRTVWGDTMGRNLRMQRVFDKLGFELMETVRDAYGQEDGHTEDRLIYRIDLTGTEEKKQ